MRPNPLAPWELRIGDLRVFYDIGPPTGDQESTTGTVAILAVGLKKGSRVWLGDEEYDL